MPVNVTAHSPGVDDFGESPRLSDDKQHGCRRLDHRVDYKASRRYVHRRLATDSVLTQSCHSSWRADRFSFFASQIRAQAGHTISSNTGSCPEPPGSSSSTRLGFVFGSVRRTTTVALGRNGYSLVLCATIRRREG